MAVNTVSIPLSTQGNADMIDITAQVASAVAKSGLVNGIVTVFTPSSTSAITTIEFESGALSDLRRLFDEIIDPRREYAHNTRWGDGNGHSHLRSALLGDFIHRAVRERSVDGGNLAADCLHRL